MKKTPEQKAATKRPTPQGRHPQGKGNPLSGKTRAHRARVMNGFASMQTTKSRGLTAVHNLSL
jgi:hypothetical protein